jgi:hypothetical protein
MVSTRVTARADFSVPGLVVAAIGCSHPAATTARDVMSASSMRL